MLLLWTLACWLQPIPDDTLLDSGVATDSGDSGGGGDSGSDTGCSQKGVTATATDWGLPEGFAAETFATAYDPTVANPNWLWTDLDGNGRTDIVMTRNDDATVEGVGTTSWELYSNTGSKFRVEPVTWPLPDGYNMDAFAPSSDVSSADPAWALSDLTGDGLLDLVVSHNDAAGIDGLGTTNWLVHKNTGEGFATGSTWSLPAGYPTNAFQTYGDLDPAAPTWGLSDLDGDGKLDLVITRYDASSTAGIGTSVWLAHLNTGSGFATTATSWGLPEGYDELTFKAIYDDNVVDPAWSLVDLDGNGRADIVVTNDGDEPGLGSTSWIYYSNTGSKFRVSSESWTLPSGYPNETFAALYDASGDDPAWALSDISGDGRLDIVITENAAAGVETLGTDRWQVHENDGESGFADSTLRWSLPGDYTTGTFSRFADSDSVDPAWTLADLDGDALLDLVVTYDGGVSGTGSTIWQMYAGECR